MTDERRWTIYVCPGCNEAVTQRQDIFCECSSDVEPADPVVVVPVSSVVPIATLRDLIERENCIALGTDAYERGIKYVLRRLSALLDDLECASNPNNERTTDA